MIDAADYDRQSISFSPDILGQGGADAVGGKPPSGDEITATSLTLISTPGDDVRPVGDLLNGAEIPFPPVAATDSDLKDVADVVSDPGTGPSVMDSVLTNSDLGTTKVGDATSSGEVDGGNGATSGATLEGGDGGQKLPTDPISTNDPNPINSQDPTNGPSPTDGQDPTDDPAAALIASGYSPMETQSPMDVLGNFTNDVVNEVTAPSSASEVAVSQEVKDLSESSTAEQQGKQSSSESEDTSGKNSDGAEVLGQYRTETNIDSQERAEESNIAANEVSIDALQRAAEGERDIGSQERAIDAMEKALDMLEAGKENVIDSKELARAREELELAKKNLKKVKGGDGNVDALSAAIASMLAMLRSLLGEKDRSLTPVEYKGGLAHAPIDPSTDTRTAPIRTRILDKKEQAERWQQMQETTKAEIDPEKRTQKAKEKEEPDNNPNLQLHEEEMEEARPDGRG
ncbi:MAG: hypothetical protein LBT98_02120 [Puniceicoccales bacterium]|jgi:hypothetical protein|nr:hypothetical protein [Puniceicoccales bacterium]